MVNFVFGLQIISGILLIIFVLLHSPKGDGIASIGAASQLFSSQKSTEKGLNKITYFFVGIFVITTFLLGFILKSKNSSLQTQIKLMKEQELKNEQFRKLVPWSSF